MRSLVIPVYRNEESLPELLTAIEGLDSSLGGDFEAVFVVDGSPDRCHAILREALPKASFPSQLLLLSRNFGSFAAIRSGLAAASGPYFAVMAADLQEPPALVCEFFRVLDEEPVDVVLGTRASRDDPPMTRWSASLFWAAYRRFVQPEMPPGGIDVFGCNLTVRDRILSLREANSTLVGLLLWLGFRRKEIPYDRQARAHGTSAWTWSRKFRYLADSAFAFSDLPVRLLLAVGALGLLMSSVFSTIVLFARLAGLIPVPGYAATILVVTFFAALNMLGLGIIGSYAWRAFENTKGRPAALVMDHLRHGGASAGPREV